MVRSSDEVVSTTTRMEPPFSAAASALGKQLQLAMVGARDESRLVCGVYDSATRLQKSSSDVALCVLANDCSDDATSHISFVLLEAFCWENFIPVLKVDSSTKLRAIADCGDVSSADCVGGGALTCLLIEEVTGDSRSTLSAAALELCRKTASTSNETIVAVLPS